MENLVRLIFRWCIMAECILSSLDNREDNKSLINQFKTGLNAYFSSPSNAILAQPPFANLLDAGLKDINQQVFESLRFASELGHSEPVVIGAIPFDIAKPPALKLSTRYKIEQHNTSETFDLPNSAALDLGHVSIKPVPTSRKFVNTVLDALSRFSASDLNKVVLSRTLEFGKLNVQLIYQFYYKDLNIKIRRVTHSPYQFTTRIYIRVSKL